MVRTELTKSEKGIYYIIACTEGSGYGDCGGFGCWSLEAIRMDDHYVLMKSNIVNGFHWKPFGVVDIDKKEEANRRLYEEAKRLGEERAKLDKNSLVDLVSK